VTWVPVPEGSDFTAANLPYGIGRPADDSPRAVVALGDHAIDLDRAQQSGLLDGAPAGVFAAASLNAFMACGPAVWRAVREQLQAIVTGPPRPELLHEQQGLERLLPFEVADYVDFYSSIHHATNLGRLFRPDGEPLLPNWRRLPVGYHGRAGTVVVSGTPVRRPWGLVAGDGEPNWQPTGALDIELEVGFVVGVGSRLGERVPTSAFAEHAFGLVLVNDWSARDIQAYEYQPLGPFLGKSFATSVSPWVVSLLALEPFRVDGPVQDPPVAAYLARNDPWALEIDLEVRLATAASAEPVLLSQTRFSDMYWTIDQHLAHATANGAATRTGDLFASGTVSGPTRGSEGSLIEMTRRGAEPITLPGGEARSFLHDGDRVILRGGCGQGDERVGFGSCEGVITAAGQGGP
jgi:fumarylacetoacetase